MKAQGAGQTAYTVYPVSSYTFGSKEPKREKDPSTAERLARLKARYEREGMRRSVEGVLLVTAHHHPHVLLLQTGQSFFRLPGGRLRPGEDEVEGLKRKLCGYLWPDNELLRSPWEVGECAGAWVRPNFDTPMYPYMPPHITKPKELRKLFIVPLPERAIFGVPRNHKLIAVPLFELFDNFGRYGPIIASLPQLLSRFRLTLISAEAPPAALPAVQAGGVTAGAKSEQLAEEYEGFGQ